MTASTTSASMDTDGAPFTSAVKNGTGLGEGHRSGISVTGHARADMLLIKPTWWAGPVPAPQTAGPRKGTLSGGHMSSEPAQITGTDPGSSQAAPELSQMSRSTRRGAPAS